MTSTETTTTKTKHHYLRALAVLVALAVAASALAEQARPAQAAFPGANGKIAFGSERDGNAEIYSMNPDGSNQTNLTQAAGEDDYPAYSPDGRQIAFMSERVTTGNPTGDEEIFRMSARGAPVAQLTFNTGFEDINPSWQPLP